MCPPPSRNGVADHHSRLGALIAPGDRSTRGEVRKAGSTITTPIRTEKPSALVFVDQPVAGPPNSNWEGTRFGKTTIARMGRPAKGRYGKEQPKYPWASGLPWQPTSLTQGRV